MERNTHTIDATGKIAGRLASQIAVLLQGKHKTSYQPNIDGGDRVEVINVKQIKFSGKKLSQKIYYRTTGYPGGIRTTHLKDLMANDPTKALRKIVLNMLPKNKFRPNRMKRLNIK